MSVPTIMLKKRSNENETFKLLSVGLGVMSHALKIQNRIHWVTTVMVSSLLLVRVSLKCVTAKKM